MKPYLSTLRQEFYVIGIDHRLLGCFGANDAFGLPRREELEQNGDIPSPTPTEMPMTRAAMAPTRANPIETP